jgi:hypothetical protein
VLSSLQSCLRATTTCLAFAQCSALSQALLVGTPTPPGLLRHSTRRDTAPTHSTQQRTGAQHHITFPPPGEPLLATFKQNSTLFVGTQHSSANSSEFVAPQQPFPFVQRWNGGSFWFSFVTSFLFCPCGKAWGIAGPPVLSAIGRMGGQNPN